MKKRRASTDATTMERREFLGVGAAMGASAYLGSEPASASERSASAPPRRAGNQRCMDNKHGRIRWAMPAEHVNTLWTLLWPRMAARIWLNDPDLQWPASTDSNGDFRDISVDIQKWIESFVGRNRFMSPRSLAGEFGASDPDDGPAPIRLTVGGTRITGSEAFRNALVGLHAYLDQPAGVRPKIYFLGAANYDFLMSDQGIHLWAPPSIPVTSAGQRALVRFYEFRRAGRPVLAMGGVMEETARLLADAPTGPGHVESIDPELIDQLCITSPEEGLLYLCGIARGALAKVEHIRGRRSNPTPEDGPSTRQVLDQAEELLKLLDRLAIPEQRRDHPELERLQRQREAWDRIRARIEPGIVPDEDVVDLVRQWIRESGPERQEQCSQLSPELFHCTLLERQCWVLTGAVFRGILEQFPRMVASIWSNDVDAAIRSQSAQQLREMCEQRMESKFSDTMRLELKDHPNDPSNMPADTILVASVWDDKQIMLTNAGVFFPYDAGREVASGAIPATAALPVEDLLAAIVDGRAGNPVFTDSSMCA